MDESPKEQPERRVFIRALLAPLRSSRTVSCFRVLIARSGAVVESHLGRRTLLCLRPCTWPHRVSICVTRMYVPNQPLLIRNSLQEIGKVPLLIL